MTEQDHVAAHKTGWRLAASGSAFGLALSLLCSSGTAFAAPQGPNFYLTHACPEKHAGSICIVGKLPSGQTATLITADGALRLEIKDSFPNTEPATPTGHKGDEILTRAEPANAAAPKGGVVVLPPVDAVKIVVPTEVMKLSTAISLADVTVKYDLDEKPIPKTGPCSTCRENTFLFRVGANLVDLYKTVRTELSSDDVLPICGKLAFAFELAGRLHTYSGGFHCETDVDFALVHDISEPTPKLVLRY
jgi:hypothetical protein